LFDLQRIDTKSRNYIISQPGYTSFFGFGVSFASLISKNLNPMKTINKNGISLIILAASAFLLFSNCKKEKTTPEDPATNNPPAVEKKYTLVIDNGAQSVEQGKSIAYTAHLVSSTGAVINATGVTWSSTFGGFSGSNLTFNQDTTGVVSASVVYENVTYNASVPICISPVKSTQLFAVVPSAIIWSTGAGPIQLNTVYFGGSGSYVFTSENNSIASVSSAGLVSFNAAGSTNIKVTATLNGQTSIVKVPVLVVGTPEAPLPVAKVVVTPALGQMFKGETLQLTAKAYNSAGTEVTSSVAFSYTVVPKIEDDGVVANAITVNSSGMVTAVDLGGAYVKVSTNGVMGQAEIVVNPDTVIMVSPFFASLGGFDPITFLPNPTSKTFTATTYKVDRAAYKANNPNFLTQIANPAGLTWEIPTTGIPEIDNLMTLVTLSNANNTSVTATAINGKVGGTFVVAHAMGIYFGAAAINVMP